MIRFFEELYLTGFVVLFRLSRSKDPGFKVGFPICVFTIIQWFILFGIYVDVERYLNTKQIFPKSIVLTSYFVIFFLNVYILFIRGHGIRFAEKFGNLKKAKRIILITTFVVLSVAGLVFSVYSGVAFRHYLGMR